MEELYSLLHNLTCGEWSGFQNYLTCFTPHDTSRLKHLQLAKLLIEAEKCPSENFCCIKLYGNKNEHAFDELKSYLKEKILDFLLTDISCDKKKQLDAADYAYIKIRKLSAQYQQLFYSKPRMELYYSLINEIIFLAKKYEYFSAAVEFLHLKRVVFLGRKIGKKEFEGIGQDIEDYLLKQRILMQAEYCYHNLMLLYDFSGKPDKEKLFPFLKKAIVEIEDGYNQTKSPIIKYYLKFLELDYYQYKEDYSKARSVCLEVLNVVRDNESVYRRQRVGVVYDNLSRCEYYLMDYKQAAEFAKEAQKHFNLNSENYCVALEQEFYALFAQKEYVHAEQIAKKMISSATRKELGEFRYAKYNYLLANALFKLNRFTEAFNILMQEREIAKDKAGWETGARVLTIMTLIEMLKHSEASLAVGSLKRFFTRTDKASSISQRDKKILNLLLIAERKGFMFTVLNGSTDKYFSALTSDEETLRWEPFTHEIIPFHEWFAGKMGKKKPAGINRRGREKVLVRK